MEFNHISANLTPIQVKWSINKFEQTTLELGVRENNYHIGTAKGGNNFQLLFLFGVTHILSDHPDIRINYISDTKTMVWGGQWMEQASRIQIRDELDLVFDGIKETHKLESLMLMSLAWSHDLKYTVTHYREQFPELVSCLDKNPYRFDRDMNLISQLVYASILCQELASDLDKGDRSRISVVGKVLTEMTDEITLLTIRRYIQIERLINHSLDEHPDFLPALMKINKKVK